MRKQFGEWYLGLDIGTNSIGWAVTDLDYKLQKINGKTMWGIRLFDAADTAMQMRTFRSGRRRIARQKWRVSLLQELFAEEISKIDKAFYWRLKESNLHEDDKKNSAGKFSLFGNNFLTDAEYYEKYPTIYHLRKALLENNVEAFDIRLLFLAVAHIMKHRGHFLFEDLDAESVRDFKNIYADLEIYIQNNLEHCETWACQDIEKLQEILNNKNLALTTKKKSLEQLFNAKTKQEKSIAAFLSGSTANLSDLFDDEELKECEKNSFGFKKDNFEEVEPVIEKYLGNNMELIAKLKAIYDWSLLNEILKGKKYLSEAKVEIYDEHKEDLIVLKEYANALGRSVYKNIFGCIPKVNNYSAYIGSCLLSKGKKAIIEKTCTQAEFCKFLRDIFKNIVDFNKLSEPVKDATKFDKLLYKIKMDIAFPKQVTKSNGVIPMQVHLVELEAILNNAVKILPFLAFTDDKGLSVKDKVIEIMKFRIPYYVGPLAGTEMSKAKKRCWVVRSQEKLYPWNFDSIVDKEASAEKFINNMTNKCTYLAGEDVLPKNSLLYTEFMARNELNNLAIDGVRLPSEVINGIYEDLLLHGTGKVTKKKIVENLRTKNFVHKKDVELTGIDDVIKSNMQSYKDFSRIFGEKYLLMHYDEIENIIRWITLFGGEKKMLLNKIKKEYPHVSDDKLNEIKRLKYNDWGRLSQKLLCSSEIAFIDESTGEYVTIIEALRRENLNFMQLLGQGCHYGFADKINEFNNGKKNADGNVTYATVENMAISPAVKRSVWQTMLIVQELKKVMGHDPKRIFIEMAREEGEKQRTKSRKQQLLELYKNCKDEERDWCAELEAKSEEDLRSNKLYLYYTQMGKCMYTGDKIELNTLYDADVCNRDHIYPRSKTKDDSLDNLVLVKGKENWDKKDEYPLSSAIQAKMTPFWIMLKSKGFISQKKFDRLTRKTQLTTEELAGFINRQLVETRQSTKAIAELLKTECQDSTIVYAKAGNVSDFRQEFNFIKCRAVNDYHHAKDAYLNVVVGNVYYTRFTANAFNFIKNLRVDEKYTLNTKEIYKRDVKRNGIVAWIAGENGTMATIQNIMRKNNILFTRMQQMNKGQLYDLQVLKKGKGQIPVKQNLDIAKYGGYNSAASAYFMLVESTKKAKKIRTIESVPLHIAKRIENDDNLLMQFLVEECKLQQPRVLLKKILKNTLLEVNGYLMHITGKSKSDILAMTAVQMILGYTWEKYIKNIEKYIQRSSLNKNAKISKFDKVDKEQNLKLYNIFINKHKSNSYANRPAQQISTLENGLDKFVMLSVEEQCKVLFNLLGLFTCKYVNGVDILAIGGTAHSGTMSFGKVISNKSIVKMYNQSVTGIFEQKIDLLKL